MAKTIKWLCCTLLVVTMGAMLAARTVAAAVPLVVGSEQEFPPFSTGTTSANAGGFTVELWQVVARERGIAYTLRVGPFSQILQEFKDGKIDVLINLAQSGPRRQFADFTVPHVTVNGAIFVRRGEAGISSEADLARKSIIVLQADLAHDYALSQGWKERLVVAPTAADCFKLLSSGKHDAVLISKLVGMQTLRATGIDNLKPLDIKVGFSQKFAFAVRKGNADLLASINEGMQIAKLDDSYDKIYDKWFGVYEPRELSLSDLLPVIIPFLLLLSVMTLYLLHRRRIEAMLRDANEHLEERVRVRTAQLEVATERAVSSSLAKSDFLAHMSHEIRTPMNAITGMLYLTLRTELGATQRDYLTKIEIASKHLLGIINDILDFSKIEAGRLDLELIDFDLQAVIQNVHDQVQLRAAEKSLTLLLDIDPTLPRYLVGDPLRLCQVLLNFANNAVKFSFRGDIVLRVKERQADVGTSLIHFEVCDLGPGIASEVQQQLFQPFRQGDTTTTRRFGGTGLGLSINKQLVTLMGGEIGVNSQVGAGSTFWCDIPFAIGRAPLGGNGAPVAVHPPFLHGLRILVAEDNILNQQVACDLLSGVGAEVALASNGAEAISLLQAQHVDCVLMDIRMPVMDGLEALARLRLLPGGGSLPVIALTANARAEEREQYLAAGMNEVVSKPIDPALLFAAIRCCTVVPGTAAAGTPPASVCPPAAPAEGAPPTGAPPSPAAVIEVQTVQFDPSVLSSLCTGRPEQLHYYIEVMLESLADSIGETVRAAQRRDIAALRTLGHKIKSTASCGGAFALAELGQKLETETTDANLERQVAVAASLPVFLERLREATAEAA